MSSLFAFNQAQEFAVSRVPGGRYDAEQQLWIADETSYAAAADLEPVCPTSVATHQIVIDSTGPSLIPDVSLD